MTSFWNIAKQELEAGFKVILMYVLESKGSSPGRQGFKMLVSSSALLSGSIGGGFMEHKLVELCKKELLKREFDPFIKRQIHQDGISKDKSGMICSGEQTIAFYSLSSLDIPWVKEIVQQQKGILVAHEKGIHFEKNTALNETFNLKLKDETHWVLQEDINAAPELHIFGGGHVGLALSKLAKDLDFSVTLYDDREGLNTMDANKYANCVVLDNYSSINELVASGSNKYVVLMSFGYRTDKIILKQLITNNFKYLGMMGSKAKVETLFNELLTEGITQEQLGKIYAPIGLPISSKTPKEIAISILAEIIQVKNRE